MISFAANDGAERDEGIVALPRRRQRDRPGDFERTGNGDDLVAMTRRLDRRARAGQQIIGDLLLKPGLEDQDLGHQRSPRTASIRSR